MDIANSERLSMHRPNKRHHDSHRHDHHHDRHRHDEHYWVYSHSWTLEYISGSPPTIQGDRPIFKIKIGARRSPQHPLIPTNVCDGEGDITEGSTLFSDAR